MTTTFGWLRQARQAAVELRSSPHGFPLAEAFFADRPTMELLDALVGLGILERSDLGQVPERGPLVTHSAA
jgi:hypothetical protein